NARRSAGGRAKTKGEGVHVAGASPATGAKDYFGATEFRHNLPDQRIHTLAASIHDALPADLDYVDPGQDVEIGRSLSGLHQSGIAERAGDESLAERGKQRVVVDGHEEAPSC